jgi:hypothetical protein
LVSSTALATGCVAHAQAGAIGDANAPVTFQAPPTLVEIESDVWVVQSYDRAVYYVSGFYWVDADGTWWRAQSYDEGWSRTDKSTVPSSIANRDHRAYVNYRGPETARTRPAPREHLASEPSPGRGHDNKDDKGGPPDHAAAQHGGPPGQNEVPGLGNQRKAEDGPSRAEPSNNKQEEKKPEKKDEKAAVKKPGPKKK